MNHLDEHMKFIFAGNIIMAVCCILYLLWWILVFKPGATISGIKASVLLAVTAICGINASYFIIRGIILTSNDLKLFSTAAPFIAGLVLYVLCYSLTSQLLHRQLTAELALIIVWGSLIFSEINALYGAGLFNLNEVLIFGTTIICVVIISIGCYILYYRLEPRQGYVDGMIPLIMIGLVMIAISIKMLV